MVYTTESDVLNTIGFDSATIQAVSGKDASGVTALIAGYISDAEKEIRDYIGYPIKISKELHYGDGNKNIFDLGPEDDPYAEEGDYDPEDCLIEIYNVWFGNAKMRKPYPEDCELGTEDVYDSWTGDTTITEDDTEQVHGDNCVKIVFASANQYAQYPDNSGTVYLDKIIDSWSDLFFYAKTTDASATFTVRLYDKDGNYAYETFTLRQNNVGEYIWLDLDTFHDLLDWDDTRVQYLRIYSDKACSLYVDNLCFADSWAFTAPVGYFHTSVAHNISSESPPSYGYPFFITYGYDPFLSSIPRNIRRAADYLVGVYLIDFLRGIKYQETDLEIFNESMEAATPFQRGGLLGVRTNLLNGYYRELGKWEGRSFGVI